MKATETIIERREGMNTYGTSVINEVVEIKSACNREFVWYRTVGEHKSIVCCFKTEKRMRKAMADFGFYNI